MLPNHLFVIPAEPLAPGATRERTYLLTHPETAATHDGIDELARFWDTVNREDIEIIERVQLGLETTPFPGGRLCYRFEEPLNRFHNMVADRMVGRRRIPPGDKAEEIPMFGARA